ncbi:MAG: hypothetical protein JNM68_07265 [Dinghuibacter sp.]|nr:hypothetical protein [Dinghuibacter sp.]
MLKIFAFSGFVLLLAAGCGKTSSGPGTVEGFKPIYVSESQAKTIRTTAPRAIDKAGKILVIGSTLYQVETGVGVHVMNISNPASPVRQGFIEIGGCQELAAKGNQLFVNNFNDLVVITPPTPGSITTLTADRRIANAFPQALNSLPLGNRSYFECPDPAKGIIVGWEPATLNNPKCRN